MLPLAMMSTPSSQGFQLLAQREMLGRRSLVVDAELHHWNIRLRKHGFQNAPAAVVQPPFVQVHAQRLLGVWLTQAQRGLGGPFGRTRRGIP